MTPNNKKVERLLTLARLSLSELEIQNISLDFKKIMKFIENEIKKDMLKNALNHDSDYFKVSKMIEDNK